MRSLLERILAQKNKEASRPLSILYMNATNLEEFHNWRKWIRRAAIFTKERSVYYHLVALALNGEFYRRMNLKVWFGDCDQVAKNKQVAWPFDLIYIDQVDDDTERDLNIIIDLQLNTSTEFFIFLKIGLGDDSFDAEPIRCLIERPGVHVEMISNGEEKLDNHFIVLKVSHSVGIAERIDFDTEEITDTMLWG